jgi:hypothetical protein
MALSLRVILPLQKGGITFLSQSEYDGPLWNALAPLENSSEDFFLSRVLISQIKIVKVLYKSVGSFLG